METQLRPRDLAIITIARLSLTTAFRILYPLLPLLAQQFNTSLPIVSALVTVQLLASLASLFGGTLADRRGARWTMQLGLVLLCIGALVCAVAGSFAVFFIGYILIGLAMALYLPAAQSSISARTSYAQRGRALGIFEVAWAGAAIIGVAPLMLLVNSTRSSAPAFWALTLAGALSLALVSIGLPAGSGAHRTSGQRMAWGQLSSRPALVLIGLMLCVMFAYDVFGVVQAQWLKETLGADEGQLGQVVALAGAAELVGSVGVAFFVDKIGKRRATLGGFALTGLALALLPLAAGNWALLIPALFLYYVCFELAIVASIPLTSGVLPLARGTMLATVVATNGIGRMIGSQVAQPVYLSGGIQLTAIVGVAAIAVGLLIGSQITEQETAAAHE